MTTPVIDPDEEQYSHWIVRLLERSEKIGTALEAHIEPPTGSALALDDERIPHYAVSSYAHGQLSVAIGCVAALKQMILRESEDKIEMLSGPFGAYALLRNSLDTAAVALWLLEPMNGTLRVKRRLQLGVDEAGKAAALRQTMGHRTNKAERRARLKQVAAVAGLGAWNPLKHELPTMTSILENLERHHTNSVFPWLAVWQLSSGHAHGKQWAQIASNEIEEIENTRTETGAQFRMTIRYGMLAAVLHETVQLIETAGTLYVNLSGGLSEEARALLTGK